MAAFFLCGLGPCSDVSDVLQPAWHVCTSISVSFDTLCVVDDDVAVAGGVFSPAASAGISTMWPMALDVCMGTCAAECELHVCGLWSYAPW